MKKLIVLLAVVMAMSSVSVGAQNLLVNPGFESGAVSDTPGASGLQFGWNYVCDNGYFRPETVLGPVVDTQAFIYAGAESQDTCGDVYPGDTNPVLAQRLAVTPDTWYTASAWVFAREMMEGAGLGSGPNDYAGIRIVELDESQAIITDLGVVGIYDVTTEFVQVSTTFKTGATTQYVDYMLDTLVNNENGYWGCRVIYDDCELVEVPEPLTIGLLSLGSLALLRRRR